QTVKGIFLFTAYVIFGESLLGFIINYFAKMDVSHWLPYTRFRSSLPTPWSGLENIMMGDTGGGPMVEPPSPALLAYLVLLWVAIYLLMSFKDTTDSSG
ncbi:MAG: hypothetical protein AAF202_10855, partial [Pseudomonadota bacterium]